MSILANARYERFAQIVANGKLTPTAAYREALGTDARDPDVNSCRWMKKQPIAQRIAELKGKTADKCSLSREAYIASLLEMYDAKPSDASMDNPRCDVLITRGQKHAVFPQKLAVGAQLSKLVGWDRPTEVRMEAGTEQTAFLGGFFAGGERWAAIIKAPADGNSVERSKETRSPASGGGR